MKADRRFPKPDGHVHASVRVELRRANSLSHLCDHPWDSLRVETVARLSQRPPDGAAAAIVKAARWSPGVNCRNRARARSMSSPSALIAARWTASVVG